MGYFKKLGKKIDKVVDGTKDAIGVGATVAILKSLSEISEKEKLEKMPEQQRDAKVQGQKEIYRTKESGRMTGKDLLEVLQKVNLYHLEGLLFIEFSDGNAYYAESISSINGQLIFNCVQKGSHFKGKDLLNYLLRLDDNQLNQEIVASESDILWTEAESIEVDGLSTILFFSLNSKRDNGNLVEVVEKASDVAIETAESSEISDNYKIRFNLDNIDFIEKSAYVVIKIYDSKFENLKEEITFEDFAMRLKLKEFVEPNIKENKWCPYGIYDILEFYYFGDIYIKSYGNYGTNNTSINNSSDPEQIHVTNQKELFEKYQNLILSNLTYKNNIIKQKVTINISENDILANKKINCDNFYIKEPLHQILANRQTLRLSIDMTEKCHEEYTNDLYHVGDIFSGTINMTFPLIKLVQSNENTSFIGEYGVPIFDLHNEGKIKSYDSNGEVEERICNKFEIDKYLRQYSEVILEKLFKYSEEYCEFESMLFLNKTDIEEKVHYRDEDQNDFSDYNWSRTDLNEYYGYDD
ncbi:hypothetical protein [Clostridium sp. 'White wine YQ']|uniref:hypothetical protein n=1 Tax=Clostridium sp. 'White wine YQ' TaxID=3027474 RepID=UPI0023666574|nr:hypothetical protein [Clostridium sp. 'White wine YQ']MDD7793459.1 hypothetical protein [Clostridium sp. 'White wine YQ']